MDLNKRGLGIKPSHDRGSGLRAFPLEGRRLQQEHDLRSFSQTSYEHAQLELSQTSTTRTFSQEAHSDGTSRIPAVSPNLPLKQLELLLVRIAHPALTACVYTPQTPTIPIL